jgi:hypothetical protein
VKCTHPRGCQRPSTVECEVAGCIAQLYGPRPGDAPAPPAKPPGLIERALDTLLDTLQGLKVRPDALPLGAAIALGRQIEPRPLRLEPHIGISLHDARQSDTPPAPRQLTQDPLMTDTPAAPPAPVAAPSPDLVPIPGPRDVKPVFTPKAAAKPRSLQVVTVPTGGFAAIEDNALMAVGMTPDAIGAAVASLLRP